MTPTVTSYYPTDRLYFLYVSGSIDSFLGAEMRRISLSTSEKSLQKCNPFIVYKQPFHKMPVWTLILL